jgi:hypothetical protein
MYLLLLDLIFQFISSSLKLIKAVIGWGSCVRISTLRVLFDVASPFLKTVKATMYGFYFSIFSFMETPPLRHEYA